MSGRIVDLFAGPGGWSEGLRLLGHSEVGIEWDDAACATARAAGHERVQADVAALDPVMFAPCWGFIASPPCQAWSMAGKGGGRRDVEHVIACARDLADGRDTRAEHAARCEDPRSMLVVEPLRWVLALRPEWVALEQVPPVLELWRLFADVFRAAGYSVWTGVLEAERYGNLCTCPEHDPRPAPHANGALSLTQLATADPAETRVWESWLSSAENVARASKHATDMASVGRAETAPVTGSTQTEALSDAWAVASLARAAMDAASDATWRERVRCLLSQALPARTIMRGRVAASWMSAATSRSGWEDATGVSIAWSPRVFWAALCSAAKSYTTLTRTPPTTIPRISGSSRLTATTCTSTTPERSRDACSLCDDYATPQTRERAVLMASRVGVVQPPVATHQRYVPGEPRRHEVTMFGEVLPWISMAEALGWHDERAYRLARGEGISERHGDRPDTPVDAPAPTISTKARTAEWVLRANKQANAAERGVDAPAPTITGGHDTADRVWLPTHYDRRQGRTREDGTRDMVRPIPVDEPAPTIASDWLAKGRDVWTHERPSPTVVTTRRSKDGLLIGRQLPDGDGENVGGWGYQRPSTTVDTDARLFRVTVTEAAILQSFRPDYPWAGDPAKPNSRTKQFEAVGNAVPPLLARAILAELAGTRLEAVA